MSSSPTSDAKALGELWAQLISNGVSPTTASDIITAAASKMERTKTPELQKDAEELVVAEPVDSKPILQNAQVKKKKKKKKKSPFPAPTDTPPGSLALDEPKPVHNIKVASTRPSSPENTPLAGTSVSPPPSISDLPNDERIRNLMRKGIPQAAAYDIVIAASALRHEQQLRRRRARRTLSNESVAEVTKKNGTPGEENTRADASESGDRGKSLSPSNVNHILTAPSSPPVASTLSFKSRRAFLSFNSGQSAFDQMERHTIKENDLTRSLPANSTGEDMPRPTTPIEPPPVDLSVH